MCVNLDLITQNDTIVDNNKEKPTNSMSKGNDHGAMRRNLQYAHRGASLDATTSDAVNTSSHEPAGRIVSEFERMPGNVAEIRRILVQNFLFQRA